MTTKKNATKPLKPSKKEARKIIAAKIEAALPELKMVLGDKLFLARVKKAAKVLGEDFALLPADPAESVAEEAPVKKKKAPAEKTVKSPKKAAKAATKVKKAKAVKSAPEEKAIASVTE
ncbi:hypothetical protein [Filimonas effusa]|uniref:Uncharacterized protein n=1 Tax=Filimonas effusa TaxID=2508721 RepID=A0A4Q1D564_9BACT|nr:hypothetical protein [Filimonas effusa]RXK83662.1 hypothetical protein ESB13_16405 [Filimonas effusa]